MGVVVKKGFSKILCGNPRRRAAFYDVLESYCRSINSLVDVLQRIYRRKTLDNDSEAAVFEVILQGIECDNLSPIAAMARLFPPDEMAVVESASVKGAVYLGFARAKAIAEKRAEAKNAILMALAYPTYILLSTGALLYFILKKTVPTTTRLIPVEQWPTWTHPLHGLYVGLVEYNWLIGLIILGLVAAIVASLKLPKGGIRTALDYLPPWGLQKKTQASVFLIALGDLINNGDTFPRAIQRLQGHAPRYLRSYIDHIQTQLNHNLTVADALDCHLFDQRTTGMVKDFSGLNQFGCKLVEIGEGALTRTITTIKVLAMTLGLLGVVVAASSNGYIALASNAVQKTFVEQIKHH